MSATSSRQGRISFRPRPIDISKPLPIIRHEIEDDESSVSRMVPMLPTGMESQEEEEVHLQEIINAANARTSHDLLPEIPIPVVKIVDGYDTAPNPNPFAYSNTYFIHKEKTDEEWDQVTEYDLDDEDEELIQSINQSAITSGQATPKKPLLTHEKYEFFLDRFEKEYHYFGVCDQSKAEQICKGLKSNIINQIYQHWLTKRKKQPNSFLRRLLKPPDREDPSPYKAFRAREVNDINKQKKARKNDAASLQKMQQLRQEMERARTIMEMIKKREKLKKDHFNVVSQIYDKLVELAQIKSLEQDDLPPPPTPSHHGSSSSSGHKKKKDHPIATTATLSSLLLLQKNATGPTFTNNDQQPLVLSGGKARQEGYRHFIVKQGEFPTPSLERQYSTKPDTPSLESSTIDLSNSTDAQQPPTIQQQQQSIQQQQQQQQSKEEKEAIDYYFNSISAPTSSNYYDDSDESDDSADESDFDMDVNTNHAISLVPPTQPRINSKGQPIYPSCNKGYIFISPKHPPILGRARVGLYGGTYIDFLPIVKNQSNNNNITSTPSKVSFNNNNDNNNNNNNNNKNNTLLSPQNCNNNNNNSSQDNNNQNNNNNNSSNTNSFSNESNPINLEDITTTTTTDNENDNIEIDKTTTIENENIDIESSKNDNIVNMETTVDSIAPENNPQSPSNSLKRKQPDTTIDDSGNDTDTAEDDNDIKNNINNNNNNNNNNNSNLNNKNIFSPKK